MLASLSSGFQGQVAVLNNIAAALASLPIRSIVTVGNAVDPGEVHVPDGPGDVRVVRSAPHHQILGDADAVVTHAGHGTAIKALAAGVPLLCLPMGRDQNDTAARVVHRGAGLRLKPTAVPDAISRALRRLLDEPQFAQAARTLATAIRSHDGCVDPVATIEATASLDEGHAFS